MTWSNINKIINKEIDRLLNLICELCGEAYNTDFTLVKYCDSCIDRLTVEMDDIDE